MGFRLQLGVGDRVALRGWRVIFNSGQNLPPILGRGFGLSASPHKDYENGPQADSESKFLDAFWILLDLVSGNPTTPPTKKLAKHDIAAKTLPSCTFDVIFGVYISQSHVLLAERMPQLARSRGA
ncbi:unnamed protein product [Protopolystoma xenopodis]|uniref:Uncharacterized protein n=1 Tax=Protopolystoma xenopodis TaxID=117903 RepID=A0A448WC79_9PLAT|nr:unnamed protein product [Protopolystoma xenopodis]